MGWVVSRIISNKNRAALIHCLASFVGVCLLRALMHAGRITFRRVAGPVGSVGWMSAILGPNREGINEHQPAHRLGEYEQDGSSGCPHTQAK